MAEVVGSIASVITITKALIAGVELVKSIYQAEKELGTLKVYYYSHTTRPRQAASL